MPVIGLLKGAYHVARRSGLLDTKAGRRCFLRAYFAYKRRWEDPYAALIRARPEWFRGGDIVDVGANVGYCSVLFAGAADRDARVWAFEPEPFNFGLLRETLAQYGLEAVVSPVQAAVGAREAEMELYVNPSHHGDHRIVSGRLRGALGRGSRLITVPVVTLDAFLATRGVRQVRFIKIDVQGYEPAVCEGMEETLQRNPGCIVSAEYMPGALEELGFDPGLLPDWFTSHGYTASTLLRDGGCRPGIPELQGEDYADLIFTR